MNQTPFNAVVPDVKETTATLARRGAPIRTAFHELQPPHAVAASFAQLGAAGLNPYFSTAEEAP